MKITAIFISLLGLMVLYACEKESILPSDSMALTKHAPSDPSIVLLQKLTTTLSKGILVRPTTLPPKTPIQVACETGNCLEVFPDLLRPYHQHANYICKDIDLTVCCCTSSHKKVCFEVQVSPTASCSNSPDKVPLPKRKATVTSGNS